MSWIIWLIVAILLIILEIFTPSLFFFTSLAIGALFAASASYFSDNIWIVLGVFVLITLLSILFIRPILKKYFNTKAPVSFNIDEIIGKDAVVTEKIAPKKQGFVKVLGEIWLAESEEEIEKDEIVTIVSSGGTKLQVKKK